VESLQVLGILSTIALLFVAVVLVMVVAYHHRRLEARLDEALAEMASLRSRLDDATRPPVQFARMRLREEGLYRFARLRRAIPRRGRPPRDRPLPRTEPLKARSG
jgi:hypothetical protein